MLRRRIESNENVQVYVDTSSAIIMFRLQHYQLEGHKWLILADNIPEIIWCNTAQDLVDMRWNFRLQSYLCLWSVTSLNMKLTWLAMSQPIALSSHPPPLACTILVYLIFCMNTLLVCHLYVQDTNPSHSTSYKHLVLN